MFETREYIQENLEIIIEEINYSHPGILFRVTGAATPYS